MDIELPEDKGTYILLVSLRQAKRLEIGRLGAFDLVPGFYAYVGSAHGSGGLRARIQHHLAMSSRSSERRSSAPVPPAFVLTDYGAAAFGSPPGGAGSQRRLESTADPHWLIDNLLRWA